MVGERNCRGEMPSQRNCANGVDGHVLHTAGNVWRAHSAAGSTFRSVFIQHSLGTRHSTDKDLKLIMYELSSIILPKMLYFSSVSPHDDCSELINKYFAGLFFLFKCKCTYYSFSKNEIIELLSGCIIQPTFRSGFILQIPRICRDR